MWGWVFAAGVFLLALAGWWGTDALGPRIQLSDGAFALAAIASVATPRPRWTAADAALAAYVACAGISTVTSEDPRASAVKLLGLGLLAAIYLLARHAPPRLLAAGWIGGATVAGIAGLAGIVLFYAGVRARPANPFVAAYGSIPVGDYPRVVAFFANPNLYASYLVSALAAIAWIWPRARARRLLGAIAALLVVNALFTLSVGLGGLALGAAVWWWARGGRARGPILAGAALVAAGFAALALVQLVPRGDGDLGLGPWDVRLAEGGRPDIWRGALRTVAEHPIAGRGYGTLVATTTNPRATVSMERWGTGAMEETAPVAVEAHDVWLSVAGQTGIPGLVAFAVFVALAIRASAANAALLGGLVAVLLYHGLFAALEDARHLWLLLGVASRYNQGDARRDPAPGDALGR